MSYTEMSLPMDIPWKRMGVSGDMIDTSFMNLEFPQKWRSSITLFYHEPTDLPPEYCTRRITYLKVVVTLSNFQFDPEDKEDVDAINIRQWYEASFLPNMAAKGEDTKGEDTSWEHYRSILTDSYPCYGALLQVGVYPKEEEKVGLKEWEFPYVSAFQPRKREMYEVVSESGEVASQSASRLNVSKGVTDTDKLEDYRVKLGGGGGGGFGFESQREQRQWGTVTTDTTVYQDVRTTDTSREKRETYSHSTNLNHIYSLLQGYHLGTNRVLFFMQPRPHIQDMKFTFVSGPRRLEGIQEFFLIINRPKKLTGLCVEARLDTAHAFRERMYYPRVIPKTEFFTNPTNYERTARALGIDIGSEYVIGNAEYRRVLYWNGMPENFRAFTKRFLETGDLGAWESVKTYITDDVCGGDWGQAELILHDILWVAGNTPERMIEDVALVFYEYLSDKGDIFVLGRRLCSCVTPNHDPPDAESRPADIEESQEAHISLCNTRPWIVLEEPYTGAGLMLGNPKPEGASGWNAYTSAISDILVNSLGSERKHNLGEVHFSQSNFVTRELQRFAEAIAQLDKLDRPLAEVESLSPYLRDGLGRTSKVERLRKIPSLTTREIGSDLEVSRGKAKKMRSKLLIGFFKALDFNKIDPSDLKPEHFRVQRGTTIPPEKLKALLESAGLDVERLPLERERPSKTPRDAETEEEE